MANGQLALQYCGMKLPLQVLRSAAGHYIGTFDVRYGPISRESLEYFPSQEAAQQALDTNEFTQRDQP